MNNKVLLPILMVFILLVSCKKETVTQVLTSNDPPLIQIIKNNFQYSFFYEALQKTGLDKLLNGSHVYTVLLPPNIAFMKSGVGMNSIKSIDSIAAADSSYLRKFIQYHIIPGRIYFTDIAQTADNEIKSISGLSIYFTKPPYQDPGPYIPLHINGANVDQKDVNASDGVIQVISNALKLPQVTTKDFFLNHKEYGIFTYGLNKFGLLNLMSNNGPFTVFAPNDSVFKANGIDSTTIASLDTTSYYKYLFQSYVIVPNRMFTTDLYGDLVTGNNVSLFTTFNTVLVYDNSGSTPFPLYVQRPRLYPTDGFYNIFTLGNTAQIVNPDNTTLNGTVQGISDILVYPDSARIN